MYDAEMHNRNFPGSILYGGDYNPEQWPRETWDRDIDLMKKAGVNCVSLGIFSWALLQPAQDRWDFSWLDEIIDRLHAGGIMVDLATATASQPPWLSVAYPDVLPVDEYGHRLNYGSRQSYCPNNPDLRRLSAGLVRRMAERYAGHPALVLWHVNNEYACHTDACYCDTCRDGFRTWLEKRYGSIEGVNEAWGTRFWSQHYGSFDEIPVPRVSSAQRNPGHVLDYRRFMSDSLLECYLNERTILKEITPDIPVTTNFMMRFKPLDYFAWAPHVDVISWDSYPDPDPGYDPACNALDHDLMRGLGGGAPFLLMEQAVNQVNWRRVNLIKPPGTMRRYSMQALAHGADGVMFFQWRQSLKGAEKYHSAMVDHSDREDSRTFREVESLGAELAAMADLAGTRNSARAAIIFDYHSWWALEYQPGPSADLGYLESVDRIYRAFAELHIPVDIIGPDGDFSAYAAVAAPVFHMARPGTAERLRWYCESGGHVLTGPWSGIVDQTDGVIPGGYPGAYRDLAGAYFTEFCPLNPGQTVALRPAGDSSGWAAELPGAANREPSAKVWYEPLIPAGADLLAEYADGPFAGMAAATVRSLGKGSFRYNGTAGDPQWNRILVSGLCAAAGIRPLLAPVNPDGPAAVYPDVDATLRRDANRGYLFIINHGDAVQLRVDPEALDSPCRPGEFYDRLNGEHPLAEDFGFEMAEGQVRILEHPAGIRRSP
jgi:beta-galactosidase